MVIKADFRTTIMTNLSLRGPPGYSPQRLAGKTRLKPSKPMEAGTLPPHICIVCLHVNDLR